MVLISTYVTKSRYDSRMDGPLITYTFSVNISYFLNLLNVSAFLTT